MSMNELNAKVIELKELKVMQDELAAEITAIEDEIKAHMAAANQEEMTVGLFKVRWTTVTSSRLDNKALKAALPDVYARYSTESVTRRFSVA